jgi:hypothetical protein
MQIWTNDFQNFDLNDLGDLRKGGLGLFHIFMCTQQLAASLTTPPSMPRMPRLAAVIQIDLSNRSDFLCSALHIDCHDAFTQSIKVARSYLKLEVAAKPNVFGISTGSFPDQRTARVYGGLYEDLVMVTNRDACCIQCGSRSIQECLDPVRFIA